jgi:DNA polymerase-3 subunit gamma/tau
MKVSQQPEGLMELPKEEFEILKKQAERFQFDQLNHLFSLLLRGEEEVAQSTFPRIMLEMTLIRMATLRPILPIDEILKKLEGLGKIEYPTVKPIDEKLEDLEEIEHPTEVIEEMESPPLERAMDPNDSQKETVVRGDSQQVREETWKGLVDFTRARNPVLGSFLALGNLVHMNDEKIEIGFEKDSFHYERMIEKENRTQLESICQEYFHRKIKVIISHLNQRVGLKGRVVLEVGEAAQNPLIQEALRLFNGRIVED